MMNHLKQKTVKTYAARGRGNFGRKQPEAPVKAPEADAKKVQNPEDNV